MSGHSHANVVSYTIDIYIYLHVLPCAFPSLSELPESDMHQHRDEPVSEESVSVEQRQQPVSGGASSLVPAASTELTTVGPQNMAAFASHSVQPQNAQPYSFLAPGPAEPQLSSGFVDNAYLPTVPMYPAAPVVPSFAPLPPPSSAIPVALTLEGESQLLTPSLNDDLPHDVLSRPEEENVIMEHSLPEQVGMATFTQPHPPTVPHPPNAAPPMSGLSNPSLLRSDIQAPMVTPNYSQPPPLAHNHPELPPVVQQQVHSYNQPQAQPMWYDQQPNLMQGPQGHGQSTRYGVPPQPLPDSNSAGVPQTHAPVPIQQAHPTSIPAGIPQTHAPLPVQQAPPTSIPAGIPQTHTPVPIQQAPQSQATANEIPFHHMNSRTFNGPINNPPSYEEAKQLPSHAPVQPPIPPPVSLNHQYLPAHQVYAQQAGPRQQIQFGHFSHPPPVPHPQPAGMNPEIAERDAKIERLMKLLEEKERETQSKANIDEQRKKKEDAEKKELTELKRSLESERNQLEQAKQQQKETAERDLQNLRQTIEAERTQMAMVLEQERLKIEATKAHYMQEMQQRESDLKQLKKQYEQEIAERQRQSAAMQQLEERRKQEHLFSLKQGLPQGWEKRLDSTTGRFYYVDHNSKTTHWNPPSSWLDYQAELQRQQQEKNHLAQLDQQQAALNARLRAQQHHGRNVTPHEVPSDTVYTSAGGRPPQPLVQPTPTKTPAVPPTATAPTEPPATQSASVKPHPSVDRSNKPPQQPHPTGLAMPLVPDRSTKPVASKKVNMTPALRKQKIDNLQAVYGSAVS